MKQDGYIALVSTIIITAILLTIVVGLGMSSIFGRFNIADSESKERSSALAEGCANQAILNLAQGSTYTGSVIVDTDQCAILSVEQNIGQAIIMAQAVVNHAYTTLKVIINTATYSIISWQEVL